VDVGSTFSLAKATASEQSQDMSVLRRSTDASWYTADKDELVAAIPYSRDNIDVSDRDKSVKNPVANNPTQWTGFSSFFDGLFEFVVGAWLYIVLIIVVLVLGFVVAYVLMNMEGNGVFRRTKVSGRFHGRAGSSKDYRLAF
jgi:hypothetical protein